MRGGRKEMSMPYTPVARSRVLAAAAALALVASVLMTSAARAQFLPAVFYGTGLQPGQTVAVYVGDMFCGSTVVNEQGEWLYQVAADASCGPTEGAPVTFAVNDQVMTSNPPATWQSGGIPAGSIATGYALTPSEGEALPEPAGSATGTPGTDGSATGTPGGDGTGTATSTGTAEGNGGSDTDSDDGGGSGMLFVGLGVVLLAAAAAGGFFIYRRNAAG
jgi:hypothetical protein